VTSARPAERVIYHNGRTHAEHCAWLDSLTGDEYRIVHMPIGHLFDLASVAYWKRALTVEMPASPRLTFLDAISESAYGPVTPEAVAAIEPMCGKGEAIISEIFSLPIEKQSQAFQKGDVFRLLARLNPSLLAALRLSDVGSVPAVESVH
jgi:hypothetical protein